MSRPSLRRVGLYATLGAFCLFSAGPILWMLVTIFKGDWDLYRSKASPFLFNKYPTLEGQISPVVDSPTLDNLRLLFFETNYFMFLWNSFIIGVLVVGITLIISLPAAYSLARLTGRWGEQSGIAIFLVYLVPPTLLFIPLFRMVVFFGLNDTIWSLVLVYPTITIPFCTWLLLGFFKSIPKDLEEAAMVDGHSRLTAFFRVALPLSFPGIVAVTVFASALTLHEFIYALTFVSASDLRTVSVGVPIELVRGDVFYWQSLVAAAVIVAIPVAVVYAFFLDRLVAGFTAGAVKG
ncbi:MAG: carbohydrate ABC transporter permease [Chloroflexi bacterium]|nr:carbohydrate ABC transporter permease [Chloroflexota bacterium]